MPYSWDRSEDKENTVFVSLLTSGHQRDAVPETKMKCILQQIPELPSPVKEDEVCPSQAFLSPGLQPGI